MSGTPNTEVSFADSPYCTSIPTSSQQQQYPRVPSKARREQELNEKIACLKKKGLNDFEKLELPSIIPASPTFRHALYNRFRSSRGVDSFVEAVQEELIRHDPELPKNFKLASEDTFQLKNIPGQLALEYIIAERMEDKIDDPVAKRKPTGGCSSYLEDWVSAQTSQLVRHRFSNTDGPPAAFTPVRRAHSPEAEAPYKTPRLSEQQHAPRQNVIQSRSPLQTVTFPVSDSQHTVIDIAAAPTMIQTIHLGPGSPIVSPAEHFSRGHKALETELRARLSAEIRTGLEAEIRAELEREIFQERAQMQTILRRKKAEIDSLREGSLRELRICETRIAALEASLEDERRANFFLRNDLAERDRLATASVARWSELRNSMASPNLGSTFHQSSIDYRRSQAREIPSGSFDNSTHEARQAQYPSIPHHVPPHFRDSALGLEAYGILPNFDNTPSQNPMANPRSRARESFGNSVHEPSPAQYSNIPNDPILPFRDFALGSAVPAAYSNYTKDEVDMALLPDDNGL
ncbi:uncharacterized protein PAC_14154 [Phialocephala subalpina]|uniref:Uncharacterized protein n=1 Tax=Phialocephala subalpina TaxID=576137 RepID=A0A1L7XH30_9HELO|nr:uncharacterized protein PAC_14154 [Phialocephala subalpina]